MTNKSAKRDEDQNQNHEEETRGADEADRTNKADELEKHEEVSPQDLRAINESLVIAGIRQMELAEIARQEQRQALAAAQEEERRRISRELHDQSGQHLAGLVLGLGALEETIRTHCPPETGAVEMLGNMRRVAEELARDLHRVAVELRPTALDDLGLVAVLHNHVERWSTGSGIPAEFGSFGLEGTDERVSVIGKITVYRVVQEALTNIVRHAGPAGVAVYGSSDEQGATGATGATAATQVSVMLQGFRDHLQVTIEDDGPGFDTEAAQQHAGRLGIAGMRERAALCRGTLHIESTPGEGTIVYLRIPLD